MAAYGSSMAFVQKRFHKGNLLYFLPSRGFCKYFSGEVQKNERLDDFLHRIAFRLLF